MTIAEALATLLQREAGAGVLVLADAQRAGFIRAQAQNATVVTGAAGLEGLEGRYDAAVIDGALEREHWDRWLLQRVHRLLRMHAPIVVVVPPLTSLASAVDLRFMAYATSHLLTRLVRRWRPAFDAPGIGRRRYYLPRLVRKLESVGYTAIEAGPGWPGRASANTPSWLARRATLLARKTSSIPGLRGRNWPAAEAHRKRYAEHYGFLGAARDAWLAAFPEYRALVPDAVTPAHWRDARVLVLAPHPDDELIGCGGTLCRLRSAGAKVSILQATDGCRLQSLRDLPAARRKTIRLEEAGRVASALGAGLVSWAQEDALLSCSAETIAGLLRVLARLRPTHVFTPFVGDGHADHRVLSRILAAALAEADVQPQILQYEVWSLVPANRYCDITDQAETLESLLLLYERAMRVEDFVHFCESRNLARGLEVTGRHAYVEAFLSTSSAEYRRLAERTPCPG
jgi:LmbE family N-acetylglucosaminyl deacetylase